MNMMLICRGTGTTRHWSLPPQMLGAAAFGLLVALVVTFSLGLIAGRAHSIDGVGMDELRARLVSQEQAIRSARDGAQHELDALAIRLGELNASIIRLNALGGRLTRMAKLQDGEFDFSRPPAVGGPEDPAAEAVSSAEVTAGLAALGRAVDREEEQLSVLAGLMVSRKLDEDVRPRGRPVRDGFISSGFGARIDPFTGRTMSHRGIDFASNTGTEVVAVATGIVTWSGIRAGYGRMVEVMHGNGYVTRYAHNAQNLVAVGDHVEQGQTIALMGASGRATGPNLHFEVWHEGRPVDPARFVQRPS
jgi:murein DD-endopeptidase MepM/ murein hydrolase activator NlpD